MTIIGSWGRQEQSKQLFLAVLKWKPKNANINISDIPKSKPFFERALKSKGTQK